MWSFFVTLSGSTVLQFKHHPLSSHYMLYPDSYMKLI